MDEVAGDKRRQQEPHHTHMTPWRFLVHEFPRKGPDFKDKLSLEGKIRDKLSAAWSRMVGGWLVGPDGEALTRRCPNVIGRRRLLSFCEDSIQRREDDQRQQGR